MPLGIVKVNAAIKQTHLLKLLNLAGDSMCPVAPQQLLDILQFPPQYQAVRIQYSDFGYLNNQVELVIDGPNIPQVEPGDELPEVKPHYVKVGASMVLLRIEMPALVEEEVQA